MKRSIVTAAAFASIFAIATQVAPGVAYANDKPVVAVLPFGSPNDHNLGNMGRNAQPTFVTQLVKSRKVRVVNEKLMKRAVKRFERDAGFRMQRDFADGEPDVDQLAAAGVRAVLGAVIVGPSESDWQHRIGVLGGNWRYANLPN